MFALDGTQVTVAALGAASAIIVAFVGVVGVLLARRMDLVGVNCTPPRFLRTVQDSSS